MFSALNQMFSALSWCEFLLPSVISVCSNGWRIIDSSFFLWSYNCWRLVVIVSKTEFSSKRSPSFDHSQLMEIGSGMFVQKELIRQMRSNHEAQLWREPLWICYPSCCCWGRRSCRSLTQTLHLKVQNHNGVSMPLLNKFAKTTNL